MLLNLLRRMSEHRTYTSLPTFDVIDDSPVGSPHPLYSKASDPQLDLLAEKEDGSSASSALFHVVCVIAGTGILQLPYALREAGWIGIVFMIMAAFVNEYTGRLLIQCLYYEGRRLSGYPEIGFVAYGKAGQAIVNVFYNSVLLGVTCLYLILAGMDLEHLVGYFTKKEWILICSVVIWIPFVFLRTLKEVSIVSLFGALASVALVIIIFVLGIIDYPNYVGKVNHDIVKLGSLATAVGSIAFSFGGNFVVGFLFNVNL